MRVLGVIRLSRETDETTSPRRQRAGITAWAAAHDHEIIGWAEDLDVSGDTSPWERPDLGKWLTDSPPAAYDIIAGMKIDRVSRSLAHFVQLIDWAKARGRHVVAYMDSVDTSTNTGELVAKVLAIFAEFERKTIAERSADSQRTARNEGRWHGGTPPYGYTPQQMADGKGWTLVPEPESAERVKEIVRRILSGSSMNAICADFNSRGIPTPSDHYRKSVGKPMMGHSWKTTALIPILKSRTLLGEMEIAGKPVTSKDDLPVLRAAPLLTYAEWLELQGALEKLSRKKTRTATTSPLLHVAFCECGLPLYRVFASGKKGALQHQYYRCKGRTIAPATCAVKTIRADELEQYAADTFLALVGGVEVLEKRLIPGEDNAVKLEQINRRLTELRADRDAGLFEGQDTDYQSRFLSLRERKRELEATPSIPDRYEDVPTGRTYREVWDGLEAMEEKRAFLLASGLRVVLHAEPNLIPSLLPGFPDQEGSRVTVVLPPDLRKRVEEHAARLAGKTG